MYVKCICSAAWNITVVYWMERKLERLSKFITNFNGTWSHSKKSKRKIISVFLVFISCFGTVFFHSVILCYINDVPSYIPILNMRIEEGVSFDYATCVVWTRRMCCLNIVVQMVELYAPVNPESMKRSDNLYSVTVLYTPINHMQVGADNVPGIVWQLTNVQQNTYRKYNWFFHSI